MGLVLWAALIPSSTFGSFDDTGAAGSEMEGRTLAAGGPNGGRYEAARSEHAEENPDADAAAPATDADRAFASGDHERALALYQQVLGSNPDDLQALRRAGLLLGWSGRAKDAVPVLERAVTLDPADRPTRHQLARVRSWAGELADSLSLYDRLVSEDPADLPAAIERARVLSWAGRLGASEKAYRDVLRRSPANTEASIGLGNTLAWQGRLDEAERLFLGAMAASPAEARLGLGRLSLYRGDAGGALSAARAELERNARNQDAISLERAALDRIRPSFSLASELSDDTDDNRNASGSATLSFHPGGSVDLDVTAGYLRAHGRDLEAQRARGRDLTGDGAADVGSEGDRMRSLSIETLGVAIGFPGGGKGRFTIGAAAERLGTYDRPAALEARESETEMTGHLAYRLRTTPFGFRLSIARDVPKWTAYIAQRNLRWEHAAAGLEGTLPGRVSWDVSADAGRIEEGAAENDRLFGLVRIWRRFALGGPWLTVRYAGRYLGYDLNLNDGYFDPQRLVSNMAGLELGGGRGAGKWSWALGADAGVERFRQDDEDPAVCGIFAQPDDAASCRERTLVGASTNLSAAGFRQAGAVSDTNTVLNFSGRLSWNLTDRFSIEAFASRTESAAQTATGFESNTFGLGARIGF